MPTFYTSTNTKKNGPQHVKDNVTDVYLCIAPLKSDTVAQIAAKAIATAPLTGADVTLVEDGNDLHADFASKSIDPTATATGSDDLTTVYCSATENLLCIDAVDRIVTNNDGDTVQIPAGRYTVPELAAAS